MRHLARIVVVMLFVLATPAVGAAQEPPDAERTHRGVWLGGGLGGGVDDDGNWAGGGYFRIGGTVGQQILLGGEAIGSVREEGEVTLSRANAAFVALFYPSGRGVFLKGGVGFATFDASISEGDVRASVTDSGFGSTVGVGYDIRIGGNLYLTPNADMLIQLIDGDSALAWLFTLGIGMH